MAESIHADRDTAHRLNPLISAIWTEDTLSGIAGVVDDFGYLLSQVDQPPAGAEPRFGRLYLVMGCIAAALIYEEANIRSVVQARKDG